MKLNELTRIIIPLSVMVFDMNFRVNPGRVSEGKPYMSPYRRLLGRPEDYGSSGSSRWTLPTLDVSRPNGRVQNT